MWMEDWGRCNYDSSLIKLKISHPSRGVRRSYESIPTSPNTGEKWGTPADYGNMVGLFLFLAKTTGKHRL